VSYNFLKSVPDLQALPSGSHILIAGLDTPFVPWLAPSFIHLEFGDSKQWAVLGRPEDVDRQHGAPPFVSLKDVHLQSIDYVARYDESGKLVNIENHNAISTV